MPNIELDVAINTANTSQSLGEIRGSLRSLIALQGQVGQGSAEFNRLAAAINNAEGRIGDLNDSFSTLRGSGVERLNSSVGLLQEGLGNFDIDKLKIAFQGLGGAMEAIPIFLLIEGIKLLIDNFDAVVGFAKELFGAFSDDEKAVKSLTKELEVQKAVTEGLIKQYDREIALLQASGASEEKILAIKKKKIESQIQEAVVTAKLNIAKIQEIANNDTLYESYLRVSAGIQRKLGFDKEAEAAEKLININKRERAKEFDDQLKQNLELIKDLQNQTLVEQATFNVESAKKAKEASDKKHEQAVKDQEEAYKRKQEEIAFDKKAEEDLAKINAQAAQDEKNRILEVEYAKNQSLINTALAEEKAIADAKAKREAAKAEAIKDINDTLSVASTGVEALSNLNNLVFAIQTSRLKEGSAEFEAAAKRNFEINKKIQIAQAVISGFQAVQSIIAAPSTIPEPFGSIAKGLAIVGVTAKSLTNIAKIKATTFQSSSGGSASSGGGGSIGGGAAVPPTPQSQAFKPETVGQVGTAGPGTSNSNVPGSQQVNKVVVVESDITRTQNKVSVIQSQASF